ncbi:MAG: ammonium transporter, partial [Deltaproteobacteria bacterium]|nr:ammonium transporter [Deltaproteobacteria bacterium]
MTGATAMLFSCSTTIFAAQNSHIDTGTTAWMLTSTALVLLMVPGLAMFYGGLVRSKNVLGTMMHSFVAMAIIGVLWAVCGYALAFGKNIAGGIIGWDSRYFFWFFSRLVGEGLVYFQGKVAQIVEAIGFSFNDLYFVIDP